MLVATDAQRLARLVYLRRLDAEEARERAEKLALDLMDRGILSLTEAERVAAGRSAIAVLVEDGKAMVSEKRGWEPTPVLQALLVGKGPKVARAHVEVFLKECEGNRQLRDKSEAMGIDIDGWREMLENAE